MTVLCAFIGGTTITYLDDLGAWKIIMAIMGNQNIFFWDKIIQK